MPDVRWTLVFTPGSLEHLGERNVEAEDIADAVYGRQGVARVRRSGTAERRRWYVIAPLDGGELLACVFRAALPQDLKVDGAFVISATGMPEAPGKWHSSMRLCVSARMADADEIRSYRSWRGAKGGG